MNRPPPLQRLIGVSTVLNDLVKRGIVQRGAKR
jgi:hypothetical protein